jgi:hypothetical protein
MMDDNYRQHRGALNTRFGSMKPTLVNFFSMWVSILDLHIHIVQKNIYSVGI